MDKFIAKNANRTKDHIQLPGRRKDANVPLNLWPLADQLDYWATRTHADQFDEQYRSYSTWYNEIKSKSGVYHTTFIDFTTKLKPLMVEMWENKVSTKLALEELRKHGVY
jgi:hypothetical protein